MAEGGDDCRYRMHEIGVYQPRRESVHFLTVFGVDFFGNRLSICKTVPLGGSYDTELRKKNTQHPDIQALDACIGGPPNYGDGGVVREVRL